MTPEQRQAALEALERIWLKSRSYPGALTDYNAVIKAITAGDNPKPAISLPLLPETADDVGEWADDPTPDPRFCPLTNQPKLECWCGNCLGGMPDDEHCSKREGICGCAEKECRRYGVGDEVVIKRVELEQIKDQVLIKIKACGFVEDFYDSKNKDAIYTRGKKYALMDVLEILENALGKGK